MSKYDYIIIGSGPSGMLAAHMLSSKYKVCVLEKGDQPNTNYFSGNQSFIRYYDKVIPIISQNIFGFGQANCLGGGSVINGALIWDLPNHTKEIWKKQFGSHFTDSLSKNYLKVVEILKVKNSLSLNIGGNIDSKLINEASKILKWKCVSVPRALIKCDHNNNCGFGCKNKNSLDILLKNKILENGGKIFTGNSVSKLSKKNNEIIYAITKDKKKFFARNYILSSGAINSNLILRNSLITKKSFIQFHLNLKVIAIHEKKIKSYEGTMFTHQVQNFIDEGIVFMPTNYTKDSLLSSSLHLKVEDRKKIFSDFSKGAIYVSQVQASSVGKIYSFFGNRFITYFLNKHDLLKIKRSLKLLIKLLKVSGFKKIVLPSKNNNKIYDIAEINDDLINNINDWEIISVHSMAANRMGNNTKDSICDINGKVHNYKNLHITDSSSLPSSVGESPQGVIMSNTIRIVDKLLEK